MPKITYIHRNFRGESLAQIERANAILAEYAAQGYDLTLRQLYYQFVARGLIPNSQKEYKNLGSIINDARLAGMIDWDHIVDRTRNLRSVGHWSTPADILESCAHSFRIDKWKDQPVHVEVWIEKDALVGVVERACARNDISFFSCRGYVSQSEVHEAARDRFVPREQRLKKQTMIIHLGDHDPSGIDMSRDIQDRLRIFGARTEVKRIALNMPQVRQYNPPPNPAKLTDSRCEGYIKEHGTESWELDALEPSVIENLIEKEIESVRDDALWNAAVHEEEGHRKLLAKTSENWDDVAQFVGDL